LNIPQQNAGFAAHAARLAIKRDEVIKTCSRPNSTSAIQAGIAVASTHSKGDTALRWRIFTKGTRRRFGQSGWASDRRAVGVLSDQP
jgi:hypothetical protein